MSCSLTGLCGKYLIFGSPSMKFDPMPYAPPTNTTRGTVIANGVRHGKILRFVQGQDCAGHVLGCVVFAASNDQNQRASGMLLLLGAVPISSKLTPE